ncbi:MAG: ABC transporter substrate-binding protein [Thermomicrobiales bacterium]
MNAKIGRRFPRRTFLTGASAGIAATALAGRGARAHDGHHGGPTLMRFQGGAANIPTPREQTVIVETTETNVYDSFNPYIPNGEAWHFGVNQLCRECMFYANFQTGEIIPWLGESWTYNADFTELTLKLNPNARWSDGQPFTSDDVLFSVEMLRASEGLTGNATVVENIASETAPDPQTVVFALNGTRPRFHYVFIAGIVFDGLRVVPKHIWEGQDPLTFANNPPVWTGPYVLDRTIPDQFMFVWRKNPDYWNKANLDPRPEFAVFRQALPPDAAVQEFTRGNIDVAQIDAIGYLNQQVIVESYDKVIAIEFVDPCPRCFFPNFDSPSGLFKTAEGRWAISYLIDRQAIADSVWLPPSRPALYPWADYASNEKWTNADIQQQYALTFDPARAEEMLSAAGATKSDDRWQMNGEDLQINIIVPGGTTVQEYQIAQTLADNAADIGLDILLTGLTFPAHSDALGFGQYDVSSHWVCGLAFDPNELYDNFESEDAVPLETRATRGNASRMQIPELDEIVAQLSVVSPDDPANQPLFDQGLEIFMRNLPAIPSIQTVFPFTFGTAYWTGWPTQDNLYNIPVNWWAQFLFVIGSLQPATE